MSSGRSQLEMGPMSNTCRRVLVTGGAGFIGSYFIRLLRAQRSGWSVVNFDLLTYAGNPARTTDFSADEGYRFVQGDVTDRAAVTAAMAGCDTVVHFAAESHVDRSIHDAEPFVSTNVIGTQVLLDACRDIGNVTRFVHVGTDEVYGSLPLDEPDQRFTEMSLLQPRSPYAASKAAADMLVLAHHATWHLPVVITRCSNNFGPYQHPEKVIPRFVTNLLDGRKVPLYGDGLNVRDWIHVEDHAEALLRVLESGSPGEIYNIAGGNEHSNLEMTRMVLEALGYGEDMIDWVADRPGHDRRYALDTTKIREMLDWSPRRSQWPDALRETIAWYRQHETWWRPLLQAG